MTDVPPRTLDLRPVHHVDAGELGRRLEIAQLEPDGIDRAQVLLARILAAAAAGDASLALTLQGEFDELVP